MELDPVVYDTIKKYSSKVSNTPALLSILYDADLLPEQIVTRRGALSMTAVICAYDAGMNDMAELVAEDKS